MSVAQLGAYDRVEIDVLGETLEDTVIEAVSEATWNDLGATVLRVETDRGVYRTTEAEPINDSPGT